MIELGMIVRDTVTTFSGMVVGKRIFIHEEFGEVLVQPVELTEEGMPKESVWLPVLRVEECR